MKKSEQQRIDSLIKQISPMVGQTVKYMHTMRTSMSPREVRDPINLQSHKLDESHKYHKGSKKTTKDFASDIITTLESIQLRLQGTPSQQTLQDISESISTLDKLNWNLGNYFDDQALKRYPHILRNVASCDKTFFGELSDTLLYCVRAVLRVVDIMTAIVCRADKNYNDQGETPFALSITGKTQFFPRPTSSVFAAVQELQKANKVLGEALKNANDLNLDSNASPEAPQ